MKNLTQSILGPVLFLVAGLMISWFLKDGIGAGSLTPPGPPGPTGTSLTEISTQVATVQTDVDAIETALATQQSGVKQIIRGTYNWTLTGTTTTRSFSPSVTPSKCQVFIRVLGQNLIVTNLTSSAITFKRGGSIDVEIEYQIVEHY